MCMDTWGKNTFVRYAPLQNKPVRDVIFQNWTKYRLRLMSNHVNTGVEGKFKPLRVLSPYCLRKLGAAPSDPCFNSLDSMMHHLTHNLCSQALFCLKDPANRHFFTFCKHGWVEKLILWIRTLSFFRLLKIDKFLKYSI